MDGAKYASSWRRQSRTLIGIFLSLNFISFFFVTKRFHRHDLNLYQSSLHWTLTVDTFFMEQTLQTWLNDYHLATNKFQPTCIVINKNEWSWHMETRFCFLSIISRRDKCDNYLYEINSNSWFWSGSDCIVNIDICMNC